MPGIEIRLNETNNIISKCRASAKLWHQRDLELTGSASLNSTAVVEINNMFPLLPGNSCTKFVMIDIKYRFTCGGDSDLS